MILRICDVLEVREQRETTGGEKMRRNQKKKSVVREFLGWIIFLLLFCGIAFLIVHFVGERTVVSGESMYPTLLDGDNLIIDKISYRFFNPDRFDIIVFPFQYQEGTYYIKRVIGLPGETVQILDGAIYINGRLLRESYGSEEIRNPGTASSEITLGADEYFVLGDNRNNSSDSREPSVGMIARDKIIGKALLRIWPLSEFGLVG